MNSENNKPDRDKRDNNMLPRQLPPVARKPVVGSPEGGPGSAAFAAAIDACAVPPKPS